MAVLVLGLALLGTTDARADGLELIVQGGIALPRYDQRIHLSNIGVSGVELRPSSDLVIESVGGPTFGMALAFEFAGVLAIEGRFDRAQVDLETDSVRFTVVSAPPGIPANSSLTFGAAALSLNPLSVWSLNLRLRTPGPVSVFASGGISRRPEIKGDGTIPITLTVPGLFDGELARVRLVAEPQDAADKVGANGGGGLRADLGAHISLIVEARVLAFKTHELSFAADAAGADLRALIGRIEPIRFHPVYFHGAGGLVIRF